MTGTLHFFGEVAERPTKSSGTIWDSKAGLKGEAHEVPSSAAVPPCGFLNHIVRENDNLIFGEVAERPKAAVLKTVEG